MPFFPETTFFSAAVVPCFRWRLSPVYLTSLMFGSLNTNTEGRRRDCLSFSPVSSKNTPPLYGFFWCGQAKPTIWMGPSARVCITAGVQKHSEPSPDPGLIVCNHMRQFLATPEQVNCNLGHLPGRNWLASLLTLSSCQMVSRKVPSVEMPTLG